MLNKFHCLNCGKEVTKREVGDWYCLTIENGCGAYMEYWQSHDNSCFTPVEYNYQNKCGTVPPGTLLIMQDFLLL